MPVGRQRCTATFVLTSTAPRQLLLTIQSSIVTNSTGHLLLTKSVSPVSPFISLDSLYSTSPYCTPAKGAPVLAVFWLCIFRASWVPSSTSFIPCSLSGDTFGSILSPPPFMLHLLAILCTSTASLTLRMRASLYFFPILNSLLPRGHFYLHALLSTDNSKPEPIFLFLKMLPRTVPSLQMSSSFSCSHSYKLCSYLHLPLCLLLSFSYQPILNPSL